MSVLRLLVLPLLLLPGCEWFARSCTARGADCSLRLLVGPDLEDGRYDVALELPGKTIRCHTLLPLPEHDGPELESIGCDDEDASITGDGGPWSWGGEPRTILVRAFTNPDRLGLIVQHEGSTLVDRRLEPDYETTEPNGEGCGECTLAQVLIDPR